MIPITPLLLSFSAVVLLLCSILALAFGKKIAEHPKGISRSAPSWSSPVPATRIFTGGCIALFVAGAAIILLAGGDVVLLVLGIALVAASLLVSMTTVTLCGAVISALDAKKGGITG